VLAVMQEEGLARGENGLEVYVMCEIPSNVVRARDFAAVFDASRSARTT
jgi:pyruvate, water dikinase